MGQNIFAITIILVTMITFCSERRPSPASTPVTESNDTKSTSEKTQGATMEEATKMSKGINRIQNAFSSQVAGQFYPQDPDILRKDVLKHLSDADSKEARAIVDRDILGIIAPHAGYVYSGPVAGEAYRTVQGKNYSTVVVMALSHRRASSKVSVMKRPAYDTPLGSLAIDEESTSALLEKYPDLFESDESVFRGEHSLEVQLPFIQVALPSSKIVPIIVAVYENEDLVPKAAEALYELFGTRKDVLFVASTDLTHFFKYEEAVKLDTELLKLLETWQIDEWRKTASSQKGMCGHMPVKLLVEIFSKYEEKSRKVSLLDYKNSGDTSGDKSRGVVGYGAIAFTLPNKLRTETKPDFGPFTKKERIYLMELAKNAVRAAVSGEKFEPTLPPSNILKENGAAFVTLKKRGELRGCIGHVIARVPLFQCVVDVARSAAIHDTRFSPVKPDELKDITYEISVLTAPEPTSPEKIEVGRDGLIMKRGGRSGLLLPQVPIEWNWNKEEFLAHTCMKAGLPSNCWKDPETTIESFRAIVFGEND